MAQAAHNPAIDPLTGCIRTDIQTEWRALILASDGSTRDCLTFYLHPSATEADARARAFSIWLPARNWPHAMVMEKVRGPLVEWPADEREQVAA